MSSKKRKRKSDSRIKKTTPKRTREWKRRSEAAKLGWRRRKNKPVSDYLLDKMKSEIATLKKVAKVALKEKKEAEEKNRRLQQMVIEKWKEENRQVIEGFALLQEMTLHEVYEALFY